MVKNKAIAYFFMPPISSVCWAAFGYLILLLPLGGFAQFTISGRVLNQANTKPVANASVFLSNASVGTQTADNGTFILYNARPGKYELIISIVGFETYHQTVMVNSSNISLPDILIFVKTIALKEVSIRPVDDPERERNYNLFKDEFLGTSDRAKDCKIINPELLDLSYNKKENSLTASSVDFLVIENPALGYRIKYLLTTFIKDNNTRKLHFEGSVLFEKMKGSTSRERRWQKRRQEVYEGSEMHFLRSALTSRMSDEGFQVLKLVKYPNPLRPPDSLMAAKINFFKNVKPANSSSRDSLSFWRKKIGLEKELQKLMPLPLAATDIVKVTDQQGIYALGRDSCSFRITYNKNHHFPAMPRVEDLNDLSNTETTVLNFNSRYAFFDNNGWVINPNSLNFFGVWGRNRVAELLPIDYEPIANREATIDSTQTFKNIFTALHNLSASHINEKAYLHFDKPYYAAGDTIYFKAYVTLGERHELSNLSGILHVDLINTGNKIDQSLKLQLANGLAWGDFTLPDSLAKGNYRVRAYTQWMRNDGEPAFFDQTITVGSALNKKVPESSTSRAITLKAKADLQFFPEGGELVAGVTSKVAFKAIGVNGSGMAVKGVIFDNTDIEAARFTAAHLGMGSFYLKPGTGKNYHAKITYADGTQGVTDLPPIAPKGIVLSINNDSVPKASVKIEANKAFFQENKNKEFNLLIYSGGIASTVPCTLDSTVIILDILKRHLFTGTATVTLFSPMGEPLCERLLFIQNYDKLKLHVSSDKNAYANRENVNIKLNVSDRAGNPSTGHFSVSIIDESKVPVDENAENTILTNLLLTSDLKGYVEQPNYYFTNISPQMQSDLDLVMLTHGYRRFEWLPLLNKEHQPLAYQPEHNLEISGTAKNGFGKPLYNATVSLIPWHGGTPLSEKTDENGIFRFSSLAFADSTQFILQAVNAKDKNATTLIYNKEAPGPAVTIKTSPHDEDVNLQMAAYLENRKAQLEDHTKYNILNGAMLKEVQIKARKIDNDYPSSNIGGPGHADQVIHAKDFELMGGQLSNRLIGLTRGIYWSPKGTGGFVPRSNNDPTHPILGVLVDSYPVTDMDDISAIDVETVELLLGSSASIYGMGFGHGVIIITTKQGGRNPKDISALGVLPIKAKGFYKAREFYSPKYEHPDDNPPRKDLRSTIYWNPELLTDKDGNASFEYYNADGTGSYRLVIEGIDEKGNLGRQVYRYKVQ